MQTQTVAIISLSLLVFWLFKHYVNCLKQQNQQNKLLLSLLSYPVHEDTMTVMLEQCLGMILTLVKPYTFPKGCICLKHDEQLKLVAQQGLSSDEQNYPWRFSEEYKKLLKNNDEDLKKIQFIASGQYIVPLVAQKKLLGVWILYTKENAQTLDNKSFISSISQALTTLIERKQHADELKLCNTLLDFSQQAIFITDKNNRIMRCNKACEQITGYLSDELIGQNPKIFKSNHHEDSFYQVLWQSVLQHGFWQGEIWNRHKDGAIYPEWLTISSIKDANDEVNQYFAIFTDLTPLKKAEKNIHQLSFYDSLTDLPNRAWFHDRLKQRITKADAQNTQFALIYLDIDHFKNINDSLGHPSGDKLLQIIAARIKTVLAPNDELARLGGDEFAILLHLDKQCNTRSTKIANKIRQTLTQAVELEGHEFITTCSMGISCYPEDSDNAEDLIKYADTAMFQAKKSGRNHYLFHTERFNRQALRKVYLESGLRKALKQQDFVVFLQPQLDLNHQVMIGAEALLRVRKGELLGISPAEYIPIAEEIGLIVEIGDWVFLEVCQLIQQWYEQDLIPENFKRVAINISPLQFKRDDFVSKIRHCIQQTKVPVKYLEIELTESSLQESDREVLYKLQEIKELGINIAIDDFGTGYSSLSRLKQFPIDLVKIDRSFVNDLSQNQSDMAIVKAIVSMAQAINIKTLAEGVESEVQVDILKVLQCDYSQGYFHSKPLDSQQFAKKLGAIQQKSSVVSN